MRPRSSRRRLHNLAFGGFVLLALMSCGELERARESCEIYEVVRQLEGPGRKLKAAATLTPFDHQDERGNLAPEIKAQFPRLLPELREDTLVSFERENRRRRRGIEECFGNSSGVGGETGAKSSRGYLEVSSVGFSKDGRQALVYVGLIAGPISRGWYILLKKEKGRWLEEARTLAWIA
jgi:hypothetical protein